MRISHSCLCVGQMMMINSSSNNSNNRNNSNNNKKQKLTHEPVPVIEVRNPPAHASIVSDRVDVNGGFSGVHAQTQSHP